MSSLVLEIAAVVDLCPQTRMYTDTGAQLGLGLNEVVLCRKVPLSEGRVEEGELQVRANERVQ